MFMIVAARNAHPVGHQMVIANREISVWEERLELDRDGYQSFHLDECGQNLSIPSWFPVLDLGCVVASSDLITTKEISISPDVLPRFTLPSQIARILAEYRHALDLRKERHIRCHIGHDWHYSLQNTVAHR
ncbi:MAG: hypothetical protein ACE5IJ_11445 [Thermoplasmata archaeon]